MRKVWITWENQRRNVEMATMVSADLYVLTSSKGRFLRYFILSTKTLRLLARERPEVIFCQNPSIVLSCLCVFIGALFRVPVIIDEHNAGLFPAEGKNWVLNKIATSLVRQATAVLVSNSNLAVYVGSKGGKAIISPDPIPALSASPSFSKSTASSRDGIFSAVLICSWAEDEPYAEVLEASTTLPPAEFAITITGRPPLSVARDVKESRFPVTLTGFISRQEYDALICTADILIVLTKRKDCLNCGAYEAVAANKPCIVSDTAMLRKYFPGGFVYVQNTTSSISAGLIEAKRNYNKLCSEIEITRNYLRHANKRALNEISDLIMTFQKNKM